MFMPLATTLYEQGHDRDVGQAEAAFEVLFLLLDNSNDGLIR